MLAICRGRRSISTWATLKGGMIGFDGCRLADGYGQKMDQGVGDSMRNMPKRIQSERKSVRNDFQFLNSQKWQE